MAYSPRLTVARKWSTDRKGGVPWKAKSAWEGTGPKWVSECRLLRVSCLTASEKRSPVRPSKGWWSPDNQAPNYPPPPEPARPENVVRPADRE